jgi:hypothetical protein
MVAQKTRDTLLHFNSLYDVQAIPKADQEREVANGTQALRCLRGSLARIARNG